jgi:MFS family permease
MRILKTEVLGVRSAALSDSAAFWSLGGILGVFLFAASAPSPLYRVYAVRWHFSPLTLTVVFALYAFGLLLALLVTGRLSDHLGRRPVILGAIVAEIAAMACFISANSVAVLAGARTLQGLATGCAIGALSAALVENSQELGPGLAAVVNSAAPTFGLAAGAIGSSALVQYGPAPLRLVYWLILAGLLVGLLLVVAMRETGQRRPGVVSSLRPVIALPPEARGTFIKVSPSVIALWALSGFYLSLVPALAAQIERSGNLLWGGIVVFCLTGSGGAAVVVFKTISTRSAMIYGCLALFVGVGITFAGIISNGQVTLIAGSVIAGVGFGLAFLGAFRAVVAVAAPSERAGTISALYIVSYLAFSVPVVIAGVAELHFTARAVALAFSGFVAVLAAFGLLTSLPRLKAPAHGEPPVAHLPPCPGTVPPYVPREHGPTAGSPLTVTREGAA